MKQKYKEIVTLEELKQFKASVNSAEGELGKLKLSLRNAPNNEKAAQGKLLQEANKKYEAIYLEIEEQIRVHNITLRNQKYQSDIFADNEIYHGNHPISLIAKRMRQWFIQNGYYTDDKSAKEIISDELNFEALNIPQMHPAREMQDSLYFDEKTLLRTHNTGWSANELRKNKNKAFSHFTIGAVYRNDSDDQTHSHQFSQCDFISVGHVTFNELIYTLKGFLSYVIEEEVEIRLRPSFFPFTEPSCEVDMFYEGRWIEVLGSGIIHPNVMKYAGYTNGMNAFAAGIGLERLAMIKYKIEDIRDLYNNDLRFLKNF
ncbi:phenylalanine--tRNA ligase subunit alpha [Mycoplasmopsis agassizii]|uniref:phenylalanine--tRNA ligase subunit alpha n=1 Tax=Mycoplasmopsis agassizii TaxID=33922 RepID=UPI00352905E5